MKSMLWIACAATVAMTACSSSNDEAMEANGDNTVAIAFQSTVGKNTRVISTNENFSAFEVMALKENGTAYFTEPMTVNKVTSGDESSWETTKTYFWQSDPLNFYAYAPTNVEGVTIDANTKQIKDYEAQVDSDKDVNDLVIATRMGATWTNTYGPVSLTFKHATAQVCIEGRMKTGANMKVDVIGAKICYVSSKGTVQFPTETTTTSKDATFSWTLDADSKKDFGVCGNNYVTLTSENQSLTFGNSMLMLPQTVSAWPTSNDGSKMITDANTTTAQGAYLAVLCRMYDVQSSSIYLMHYPKTAGVLYYDEKAFNAAGYAWAAVPVNIDWVAGNRYTYVLTFSDNSAGYIDPLPTTGGAFGDLTIATDPLSSDTENPKNLGDDILGVPITFGSITVDTFVEKNDASHHPLN